MIKEHESETVNDVVKNEYVGDVWHPSESLGEWMHKRFKATSWTVSKLTERGAGGEILESSASPASVYRMSRSPDYFVATSALRDSIAWNKAKKKGANKYLGYYGYPPTKDEADPKNPFAMDEQEKLEMMSKHYWEVMKSCDRIINTQCHLCTLNSENFSEPNPIDTEMEVAIDWDETYESRSSEFYEDDYFEHWDLGFLRKNEYLRIFASSHKTKQYGPIKANKERHFEAEIHICLDCAKKFEKLFLMSISDVINGISINHDLNQKAIARELGLENSQPLISKMQRGKIEFISPLTLKKLIGLWAFGTLQDDALIIYNENAYLSFYEELELNGFDRNNFNYRPSNTLNSPKAFKPEKWVKPDANGQYSLKTSCDLLVTTDNGLAKIACYFFPEHDLKTISVLIAAATNLEATHVCFIVTNSAEVGSNQKYFCLNISSGIPQICGLPKNYNLTMQHDFDNCAPEVSAQFSILAANAARERNQNAEFIKDLFATPKISKDEIYESSWGDANSIMELLNWDTYNERAVSFQKNIVRAIERGETTREKISEKYSISEDIVYAWESEWVTGD